VAAAESLRASLSFPSDNGKTGPIAVSSTSRLTCPSSCPLAGNQGCYAEAGFHTWLHWDRLSRGESGFPAAAFIKQVMALPAGILFRHCVAGDQWPDPADPLRIDQALLLQLARATRHLRAAWSFTHFPMGPANLATIRLAASKGLVVNASTESRSTAAALVRQGIPAVCVVPPDAPAVFRHEGVRFVACPASRGGSGPLQLKGAALQGSRMSSLQDLCSARHLAQASWRRCLQRGMYSIQLMAKASRFCSPVVSAAAGLL
jgi:hypothetical protein